MISFNNLGNLGRLANQMFQYASLKGIARNRGYDFSIPPVNVFGKRDPVVATAELNIYDVFGLDKKNTVGLFPNCPDNIDIFGYYQTHKYFEHIEDELREDFTFDADLVKSCKEFLEYTYVYRDVIALHIRRGDYVSNPNLPSQPMEYYQRGLEMLPDLDVIVFSDDAEWCKQQEIFSSDRFSISEGNTTDADLCLMSMCQYHIIANSSFSWWGAWLARSKKVIAPKNWFGGDCVNKDVSDMEFANWVWI